MAILVNKYIIAFVVPIVLIVCGGVIKKLVRGTPSWRANDFYLGIEMLFAAFTSAIFNIISVSNVANTNLSSQSATHTQLILESAIFLVFAFFMLLVVMGIHQWQENSGNDGRGKIIWMGYICNAIGTSVLAVFYLGVMTS